MDWVTVTDRGIDLEVNRQGVVRSPITGRIKKPLTNEKGYHVVTALNKYGVQANFKVHRLVAFAYVTVVPGKDMVNHIDGIKKNNVPENLEWVTNQENMQHAVDNGLTSSSNKHPHVTKEEKVFIVNNYKNGCGTMGTQGMATRFGYTAEGMRCLLRRMGL